MSTEVGLSSGRFLIKVVNLQVVPAHPPCQKQAVLGHKHSKKLHRRAVTSSQDKKVEVKLILIRSYRFNSVICLGKMHVVNNVKICLLTEKVCAVLFHDDNVWKLNITFISSAVFSVE